MQIKGVFFCKIVKKAVGQPCPDGLVFYLINVRFRKGSSPNDPLDNPQTVGADDAQCILKYYTQKDVAGLETSWEKVVGYDLIDEFYKQS